MYVLWSSKLRKRYVGSCQSLETRLREHNSGQSKFTKGGIPWVLVHQESFESDTQARRRELHLKSGSGRTWLDNQFPEFKRSI